MNGPIDTLLRRQKLESFARLLQEKRRREERRLHAVRGHRNEEGQWIGGLLSFMRYFWHILEPGKKMTEGWVLEAIAEHLEAVAYGEIKRLLITVPPGCSKSLMTDVFFPAWLWATGRPEMRFLAFSYSSDLTHRDNGRFRDLIQSAEYQAMYGHLFVLRKTGEVQVSNDKHGWKVASSVGGMGTGARSDGIVIDDAHSIKTVESDDVRNETGRWFREVLQDRLNDMTKGWIVAIMQRSHEDDIAGIILSDDDHMDYVHLNIPMEFIWSADEDGQPFATEVVGWIDPRWTDDPNECEGALMWPERFPEDVVENLKRDKAEYAYCTPAESPVLMADLSMRPISSIIAGDKIVGFKIGDDITRARYTEATVLSISKSVQPVVRVTLSSGHVIRCTPDHKWYTGRGVNDPTHPAYAPARIGPRGGNVLRRVCPPSINFPATEEAIRAAAWVGGFFDGEGSVSQAARRDDGYMTANITFTQSAGYNLPICSKLEANLRLLGFEFSWVTKKRRKGWQPTRYYWLKAEAATGIRHLNGFAKRMPRLTLYQRFLHVVQPTKWRDRIIRAAVFGRMFTTSEKVISIEPDRAETVYGLETTTGNYVVWGLASSNSGQYQQTPSPRGGGIIKREYWQPWEGKFPAFSYIFGSLDGAFTEDDRNDPSAMSVWGVFQNEQGRNRLMLMFAWAKWLAFEGQRFSPEPGENQRDFMDRQMKEWGLVEWCEHTARYWKCDKILIEAKANGISVGQSLEKRYRNRRWVVQLIDPKGADKTARTYAVQSIFSQHMIHAPLDRQWCQDVVNECGVFPFGKHDDRHDSVTQAVKHAGDIGLLEFDEDVRAAEIDEARLEVIKAKSGDKLRNYLPGT
jgi:predicted phage terminase large subunit-like protein